MSNRREPLSGTPIELLREVEEDTKRFRWERGDRLTEIAKGFEREGDSENAQKVHSEAAAFRLCNSGDTFPGYFQPSIVFADGRASPCRGFFTGERLEHLKERAKTCANPIHAARFADVVWDLSASGKKDPGMARLAITKYLVCCGIYRDNLWGVEFADSIKRAAQLSSMLKDEEALTQVRDTIFEHLAELDRKKDYRFCIELAEAVTLSARMRISEKECGQLIGVLDNTIAYFRGEHAERDGLLGPSGAPDESMVIAFHEAKLSLRRRCPAVDAKQEKGGIAEAFERAGDAASKSGGHLKALSFYMDADKRFSEIGARKDMERVRGKLRSAGLLTEQSMKAVSVPFELDPSKVDEYLNGLMRATLEETLAAIAANFIPDLTDLREEVETLSKEHPIQFLIRRVDIREGRAVGWYSGEEEMKSAALYDALGRHVLVNGAFLRRAFDRLRKEKGLETETLLDVFPGCGLCTKRNISLLRKGFERYFSGDHVSALHILVPQFEDLLRNLFEQAGWSIQRDRARAPILQDLLRFPQFTKVVGESLHLYYTWALTDVNGLNVRNEVCHGFLPPERMTRETVELILHLLLTLTLFRIEERQQGDEQASPHGPAGT